MPLRRISPACSVIGSLVFIAPTIYCAAFMAKAGAIHSRAMFEQITQIGIDECGGIQPLTKGSALLSSGTVLTGFRLPSSSISRQFQMERIAPQLTGPFAAFYLGRFPVQLLEVILHSFALVSVPKHVV